MVLVKGILHESACACFCGGGILLVKGILVCAGFGGVIVLMLLEKSILDKSICAGVRGHCA